MFGLFKKRPLGDKVADLLGIFEQLSEHADRMYADFDRFNIVEVRFFTMSAISVFVQSHGNLPETEMQQVVSEFTNQAVASLILKMPQASFDLVHNAFVDRFHLYADLIVELDNADDPRSMQLGIVRLMSALDQAARVERDVSDALNAGTHIVMPLNHAAGSIPRALR